DLHLVIADGGNLVDAAQQSKGVVQEGVVHVGGDARELGDDGLDFRNGRKLRELHQSHLARDQIWILNHCAAEEELASGLVRRQGANGIPAQGGVFVEQ